MGKCSLEFCEECGRKKDLPLVMYNEIRELRDEVDGFRKQVSELLEIMGYRRKTYEESIVGGLYKENPILNFFKKKEPKPEAEKKAKKKRAGRKG